MNQFSTNNVATGASTDAGLRTFLLGTYRYMAMAMGVTAVSAYVMSGVVMNNQALRGLLSSPIMALVMVFGIMGAFGVVGRKLPSMSKGSVIAFLFGFAAFMGFMMSLTVIYYPSLILAKVFFMTVALFGALSMYGYTTNRDLTPWLKFAAIGFGVFVGYLLLSMFVPAIAPTGMMETAIMGFGLVMIAVITAGQTQMLKRVYYSCAGDPSMQGKMQAYGAASLLLTFINMFQILLSLVGRD